ncbi:MAG: hypothetical protein ACE5EO_05585 [Candidatus Krumholzibacteriia bacterium]
MLRLSKVMVLSLLVVCVASAAFATTSRVQALAGTSNYINDDSNIFRWYGTLPSYANLVMAEGGQATPDGSLSGVDVNYQALGFTYSWGEDSPLGTWAIFLLKNSLDDMSFFAFNPLATLGDASAGGVPGTTAGALMPTTKFVLGWGNELEQLSYGLVFSRSDASSEVTAPLASTQENVSFTAFGAGVRADLGDKAYFDISATYGTASGDSIGPGGGGDKFDSSTAFDISGRLFWEWRDDVTVVPYVGFQTFEYSANSVPATVTNGVKGTDFTLGVSFNMDVNTSNMLVFATEFETSSTEPSDAAAGDQTDFQVTTLPKFFMAVESDINSWLTTRVGATKSMDKSESTDAAGTVTTTTGSPFSGADFEWFLGAGFHLGDWDVDAVLSQDTPFRLGYWLTGFGANDTDPPIGRLSGTYRF